MSSIITLENGAEMPLFGLGSWGGSKSDASVVAAAVREGLVAGYRNIDCAEVYRNQSEIGAVLKEAFDVENKSTYVCDRKDVFITSKVWNTKHAAEHVRESALKTLQDLQLEYLDLLLVHWPLAFEYTGPDFQEGGVAPVDESTGRIKLAKGVGLQDTWRALEALVDEGLVRSIGVSNYNVQTLTDLLSYARIHPQVNQVELSPFLAQEGLLEFCSQNNVACTAYSPLGRPGYKPNQQWQILLEAKEVVEIAARWSAALVDIQVQPAQVVLVWAMNRGTVAIPKSANPSRIRSNLLAFTSVFPRRDSIPNFQSDIDVLDGLDCNLRVAMMGNLPEPWDKCFM
jgi:diketogulonate reductase-like aldo/keto reductase